MGGQLRRQLLLDGGGGSVVFVATATDDLDALEVAAALVVKGVATYSGISEAVVSLRAHAPDVRLIRRGVTSVADMQMQLTQRLRRDTSSLKRKTDALAGGWRGHFPAPHGHQPRKGSHPPAEFRPQDDL